MLSNEPAERCKERTVQYRLLLIYELEMEWIEWTAQLWEEL